MRADAADLGPLAALRRFARFGVAPLAPRRLREWRHRLRARWQPHRFANAQWMSAELVANLQQRRAEVDRNQFAAIANVSRRNMQMVMDEAFVGFIHDLMARQCARGGYQLRSPMYARQFVEFAFSIPEHTRCRGEAKKYTHARALRGWMPDAVVRRQDKADFMFGFERIIDGMGNYFTKQLPEQKPEYFNKTGMSGLYRLYREGRSDEKPTWELWGCFSCENMLRTCQ